MGVHESISVLFFLRRIGPYHHARFQEASRKIRLVAIETRPLSQEYPWQFTASGNYSIAQFPVSKEIEMGIRGKALAEAVEMLFEKYKPDVVVTTGWADPEYHAVVLEAARRKVPRVVISDSRYESEPRKFHKELVKRIILKAYSSALVAGTTSKAYLERLKFSPRAIFKPWDVVDNSYFTEGVKHVGVEHETRYFFCISRFIPEKNIPRMIQAYHGYRSQGGTRKLVIAGGGTLESQIRKEIQSLQLNDSIDLVGFLTYKEIPKYLAGALCLILPSVSDTWGLVVNEAMASGLPVIVSQNCGCAVDLVREKENGCIFDPLDVECLKHKMLDMSSLDEETWKRMGDASKSIIAHWDLGDFRDGLYDACSYALDNPSKNIVKPVHILLKK